MKKTFYEKMVPGTIRILFMNTSHSTLANPPISDLIERFR